MPTMPPALEKPLLARNVALPHAQRLADLLRPLCARVEIAGSLRREKDAVSDIEIVALPLAGPRDLFGHGYAPTVDFSFLVQRLIDQGVLRWDTQVPRNGRLYKRFVVPAAQGLSLDLFMADPDNWGNTLAIRTGSAAFSKFLVSTAWSRKRRRQQDGYLWQCLPGDPYDSGVPQGRERIACPTEENYFAAVGVPFVEPRFRSEAMIAQLRKEGL